MKPYMSQIAFSITDMARTIGFYRDVFGLEDAGEVTAFRGPGAEYVQGIKGIASRTHWLQDGRRGMQLEFFVFEYPPIRPLPAEWRACDIGMTRIAFEVVNIDVTITLARDLGAGNIRGPMLIDRKKHAVLEDPDGIIIEIIEAPGGFSTGRRSRIAGVAQSVSNLKDYIKTYTDGLSQTMSGRGHGDIDTLLGLEGARRRVAVIEGEYAWLELSEYLEPKPAPRRSGHLLTDIGLSHIAYSVRNFNDFKKMYKKLVDEQWLKPHNPKPMFVGNLSGVMYSKDREGFTIETMYLSPVFHGMFGFDRPGIFDRFVQSVMNAVMGLIYGRPVSKETSG